MPNGQTKHLNTIGVWNDVTLHDMTTVDTIEEFEDIRTQCLRTAPEYDGLGTRVIVLADTGPTAALDISSESDTIGTGVVTQIVFDAAYERTARPYGTGETLEYAYRESVLALAYERVILPIIDSDLIYTATVVGGDNMTASGDIYTMYPALHILVDGAVSKPIIIRAVTDLYDYMSLHGYHITGAPSDFLIDIDTGLNGRS